MPFVLATLSEPNVVVPELFCKLTPGLPVALATVTGPVNVMAAEEFVIERADCVAFASLLIVVVPLTVTAPPALSIARPASWRWSIKRLSKVTLPVERRSLM